MRLARRTACACIQWRPSTRCSTWTGAPSWSACWRRAPLRFRSSPGASHLRSSRRWFTRFVGDARCSCRSSSSAMQERSAQPPRRRDAPVVLTGGHYTQLGDCLAALERWPHLYLETSRLAQFRGVETVVRAVGAQRLLFGSDAPARPIQPPLERGADRGHRRRRQARHSGWQRQSSVRASATRFRAPDTHQRRAPDRRAHPYRRAWPAHAAHRRARSPAATWLGSGST